MPIDPSIILGVRPVQIPQQDPLEQFSKGIALKGLLGQQDLQALQTQHAQQEQSDDAATRSAYQQAGGDSARLRALLQSGGQYKGVQALDKFDLEKREKESSIRKNSAAADKNDYDVAIGKVQHGAAILSNVTDQPTYDAARRQIAMTLDPKLAEQMPPVYDPAFVKSKIDAGMTVVQKLTDQREQKRNELTERGQNMTDARTRGEGEKNRAAHFQIAGLNADGTPKVAVEPGQKIDLSTVTPDVLAAAHRYRQDGTLPPNMGRGAQGAAESKLIRTLAAQLDAEGGMRPEDARVAQLAFKGDAAALAQLTKREQQIGANVKNFDFNAGQVRELSQKVDRTGVPIVNAWLNAGKRAVAGNPDLAAFDVAVKTTVNEFAQIVSGTTAGATTEGEKQKAEKLLNAQQTPEQILSVLNQMEIESKNRMKSFADQKSALRGSMGGRPEPKPAEQPTPAVGAGAPKGTAFNDIPDPAKYKGRRLQGPDGGVFLSDGVKWKREK